jgi:hypothetical protein
MAQNLDGDMKQGPTMCACHLGFIQQIITMDARNNNTTIELRTFVEIHLHLTKKSSSKP